MELLSLLLSDPEKVVAVLFGVKVLAGAVVNLTPTPKDDAFLSKVYPFVEFLAGIWTKRAKQ